MFRGKLPTSSWRAITGCSPRNLAPYYPSAAIRRLVVEASVTEIPNHPLTGTQRMVRKKFKLSPPRPEELESATVVKVQSIVTCNGENLMGAIVRFEDGTTVGIGL
jgi:hypothetical protein